MADITDDKGLALEALIPRVLEMSPEIGEIVTALCKTQAALKTVKGLTVRQTEELVRKYGGEKQVKFAKQVAPEIAELEERLRNSLETDVKLRYGKKGGTVTIRYYSDEELDKLLSRLL